MAAFVAGATARGVQLDSLAIEIEGELDLHGFLGIGSEAEATVGFPELRYRIHVTADASEEELEAIRRMAVAHSPNAMTIARAVALKGELIARPDQPRRTRSRGLNKHLQVPGRRS